MVAGFAAFGREGKLKNDEVLAGVAATARAFEDRPTGGREFMQDRFPDLDTGCRFWLTKAPVRMYPGFPLPAALPMRDKARLLDCIQYLQPDTNMLYHRVDDEQRPLSVPLLARRLGMHPRECYSFVRRMIAARVMAREKGRLYVNPLYFFRGTRLRQHLFFLFEADLSSVLPAWTVEKFTGTRPDRRFNAYV